MTRSPEPTLDEAVAAWAPHVSGEPFVSPRPHVVDVRQVVYALDRARDRLQAEADALGAQGDYAAEFPAEDADRMREAIALLQARPVA